MKKAILILAAVGLLLLCACDSASEYESYQAILDDYTAQMQEAVPGLIDEYNAEAAENTEGVAGLAVILNKEVTKLARICNDGTEELAKFYYSHGSGEYDEYEDWAGKMYDAYLDAAGDIQVVYMNSAM